MTNKLLKSYKINPVKYLFENHGLELPSNVRYEPDHKGTFTYKREQKHDSTLAFTYDLISEMLVPLTFSSPYSNEFNFVIGDLLVEPSVLKQPTGNPWHTYHEKMTLEMSKTPKEEV